MAIPSTGPEVLRDIAKHRGWESRQAQIDMSTAMDNASKSSRDVIVSAPVGVGKTGGYVSVAVANGNAVISTSTKALQDQVIDDLQDLHDNAGSIWGESFTFHLVKGKSSYVNTRLLSSYIRRNDITDGELVNLLSDAEHAVKDQTGEDFESQLQNIPYSIKKHFTDDNGASVDSIDTSTHAIAVNIAANSDIVVVNTALLVKETMKQSSALLSGRRTVIIDEAHHAPSIVRSASSIRSPDREASNSDYTSVAKQGRVLAGFETMMFDDNGFYKAPKGKNRGDIQREAKILLNEIIATGDKKIDGLKTSVQSFADGLTMKTTTMTPDGVRDIPMYNLAVEQDSGMVLIPYITNNFRFKLADACGTEDSGGIISLQLCSGTLDEGYGRELGMRGAEFVQVPGPYDTKRCKLYLPASVELDGGYGNSDRHDTSSIKTAVKLCKKSDGGALVLTTSTRMVKSYTEELRNAGFNVYSSSELSKKEAVAGFKEDPTGVLVGTRSFWEGLDIPGQGLRLVIIDKILFPTMTDHYIKTKEKLVKVNGGNTFNMVFIPEAKTMMAQGVGRLIRSHNDIGTVAILDSRLRSKKYGGDILSLVDSGIMATQSLNEAVSWIGKVNGDDGKLDPSKWAPLKSL